MDEFIFEDPSSPLFAGGYLSCRAAADGATLGKVPHLAALLVSGTPRGDARIAPGDHAPSRRYRGGERARDWKDRARRPAGRAADHPGEAAVDTPLRRPPAGSRIPPGGTDDAPQTRLGAVRAAGGDRCGGAVELPLPQPDEPAHRRAVRRQRHRDQVQRVQLVVLGVFCAAGAGDAGGVRTPARAGAAGERRWRCRQRAGHRRGHRQGVLHGFDGRRATGGGSRRFPPAAGGAGAGRQGRHDCVRRLRPGAGVSHRAARGVSEQRSELCGRRAHFRRAAAVFATGGAVGRGGARATRRGRRRRYDHGRGGVATHRGAGAGCGALRRQIAGRAAAGAHPARGGVRPGDGAAAVRLGRDAERRGECVPVRIGRQRVHAESRARLAADAGDTRGHGECERFWRQLLVSVVTVRRHQGQRLGPIRRCRRSARLLPDEERHRRSVARLVAHPHPGAAAVSGARAGDRVYGRAVAADLHRRGRGVGSGAGAARPDRRCRRRDRSSGFVVRARSEKAQSAMSPGNIRLHLPSLLFHLPEIVADGCGTQGHKAPIRPDDADLDIALGDLALEALLQRQHRHVHRVLQLDVVLVSLLQERLGVDHVLANRARLPKEETTAGIHLCQLRFLLSIVSHQQQTATKRSHAARLRKLLHHRGQLAHQLRQWHRLAKRLVVGLRHLARLLYQQPVIRPHTRVHHPDALGDRLHLADGGVVRQRRRQPLLGGDHAAVLRPDSQRRRPSVDRLERIL
eukprot:ctg_193.g93